MHHPTDRITHITAFVTPVVEHWLKREIVQWVHPMKDRSVDPPHHERTLYIWATSRSSNDIHSRIRNKPVKFAYIHTYIQIHTYTHTYYIHIHVYIYIRTYIGKEGNVLFNDALNTFYLRLYGVRHGKGPLRCRERKPAAATWATLCD